MGGNSVTTFRVGLLRWMALAIGVAGLALTAACTCLSRPSPEPDETISEAAAESPSMAVQIPLAEELDHSPETEKSQVIAEPSAALEGRRRPAIKTAPDIAEPEPTVVTPQVESQAASDATTEQVQGLDVQQVEVQPEAEFEKQADKAVDQSLDKPVAKQIEKQAEKPSTPPLDLDLLEKRLRETSAIGVFTKLALKNQVDDLLDKFQAFYQGHSSKTLDQLRQPYDMLMMKVLALLQDSDPPLARDILESREAIWAILSDPEKFASY